MSSRSMTDIAYELMKRDKNEAVFSQLWQEVSKVLGLNETQAVNKIASFYSALMLDTRFTLLADNKWDLRERHRYNETHVDTSSILIDDEDEEYEEGFDEETDENDDEEKDNDKEFEEDEKDF